MWESSELQRLQADLHAASAEAERKTALVVQSSAFNLEAHAKAGAPWKTGNLFNSIGVDITDGGMTAVIGPTAHYGGYVENGTYKMAPQPYMGPATDFVEPRFIAAVQKLGGDIL